MPRKKKSALDSLAELPDDTFKNRKTWDEKLKESFPDTHKELVEIIQSHKAGGVAAQKFKTIRSLKEYLAGQDPVRPLAKPLIPKISVASFSTFYRRVPHE